MYIYKISCFDCDATIIFPYMESSWIKHYNVFLLLYIAGSVTLVFCFIFLTEQIKSANSCSLINIIS